MIFEDIGLQIPDILLPSESVDLQTWPVIACDQYSSQPDYWRRVADTCGNNPSSLALIYPEVFLNSDDKEARIAGIHRNMRDYLQSGILTQYPSTLVLCERTLRSGATRKGAIVALDLEHYSYESGAQTLIRSTEGTIVDRLPPRIAIREQAPLESPHIMVLIDDPEKSVIEPLFENSELTLYDTALMLNSGHLRGWAVRNEAHIANFVAKLQHLADPAVFQKKYQTNNDKAPLLYAMGDGNHSFATAKAIWESLKQRRGFAAVSNHPARYALVELVNLFDDSLQFEPIHRVLFNVEVEQLLDAFLTSQPGSEILEHPPHDSHGHLIPFISASVQGTLHIPHPTAQLAVGSLQKFLDSYLQSQSNTSIDYIHGEQDTKDLAMQPRNIGFLLPAIDKHSLFKTVIFDGSLPRKTFSMGDAEDKRFYFECRKIQE